MSAWQAYVDPILGVASGAAICGLDGQVWASSNLTVEPDEVKAAMAGFADSNNLEKVSVGGVKYTFINRSEDKELHVKKVGAPFLLAASPCASHPNAGRTSLSRVIAGCYRGLHHEGENLCRVRLV